MTAQEIQTNRLQRMMCCIAQKSLELSDILSLGNQKKIKCKTEELELLNIYFEILKCHVPDYDEETCIDEEQVDSIWDYICEACN